ATQESLQQGMRYVYNIQKYNKITPYEITGLFNEAYARVASLNKRISGFKATGIFHMNRAVVSEDDFVAVGEYQKQVNEQTYSAVVAQCQRFVFQQLYTESLPSTFSGIQQELETRLEPAFVNPATISSTTNDGQEQSLYPDLTISNDTQQQSSILQAVSTNKCDAQTSACLARQWKHFSKRKRKKKI
ncbi:hypothetical protein HHI36_004859, partial [Cryptolaemus montrouzieri]